MLLQTLNYKEYLKDLLSLICPNQVISYILFRNFKYSLNIRINGNIRESSVCANYLSTGANSGTGSCLSEYT